MSQEKKKKRAIFTYLKWSCKATLKSKESPRSAKPRPIKAWRPTMKTLMWRILCHILEEMNIWLLEEMWHVVLLQSKIPFKMSYHFHPLSGSQSTCWSLWRLQLHCLDIVQLELGQKALLQTQTGYSSTSKWNYTKNCTIWLHEKYGWKRVTLREEVA